MIGIHKSTKKFGPITTTHRNWRASHNLNRDSRKCAWIHGYSRYIEFTFIGELDEYGWVHDFGDCKFIKEWLEENWDHKVLISSDDPKLELIMDMEHNDILCATVIPAQNGWGPGMEESCKWVFDNISPMVDDHTDGRVSISSVRIWEHENNSAMYSPTLMMG